MYTVLVLLQLCVISMSQTITCLFDLLRMSAEQQLAMEKDSKRFEPVETQPSRLFQWAAQKGVMFEP